MAKQQLQVERDYTYTFDDWFEELEEPVIRIEDYYANQKQSIFGLLQSNRIRVWASNKRYVDMLVYYANPEKEIFPYIVNFIELENEAKQIDSDVEKVFQELAEKWREETEHLSSITKQVMNFNYQRIIGLGPVALPILFRELEQRPDYWFWALKAITGEDPTRPEDAGNIEKMAESWLQWAKRNGYLNVSQARIPFQQSTQR